jgi:hypothetical protein
MLEIDLAAKILDFENNKKGHGETKCVSQSIEVYIRTLLP